MVVENKFYGTEFSENINTLVVDDDNTCLIVTAVLLRKQKYQVVTAKNAQNALFILRIGSLSLDLIISDVHMPEMNGFQLQQEIAKEFDISVILMSVDERESTSLTAIESGGTFFILKPICEDDIRDLWQYVIMQKNNYKSVVIDEIGRSSNGPIEKIHPHVIIVVESSPSINKESNDQKSPHEVIEVESSPSVSEESNEKRDKPERKHEENVSTPSKKSKIVWTPSLHCRFLNAIVEIGLDKAIPIKIHPFMDIPELTTRHVASYLQKYRVHLQKLTSNETSTDNNIIQENSSIQSTLASENIGSSSLVSDSSYKITRKSAGSMHVATSTQQLVHGKITHQAGHSDQSRDKEFADFMTRHITRKPSIDESTNQKFVDLLTSHIKRKTHIDIRPFGAKELVELLTSHITQKPCIDSESFEDKQFANFLTGHPTDTGLMWSYPLYKRLLGAGTTFDFTM